MKNWDDIRIFLAVAREGSIRRAAIKLNINHSTVSRRVTAFEEDSNVRYFERMATGYLLTSAGEELFDIAQNMEEHVAIADRNLLGRDSRMSGTLKVSLPTILSTTFLIKEYAEFNRMYPDVDLQLNHTYEAADLNRREADVAIRFTNNPPETLVGRKVSPVNMAVYISKEYWSKINDKDNPEDARWLFWKRVGPQDIYIKESIFPHAPKLNLTNDPEAMLAAVKAGIGISGLVCMSGDMDPDLMRIPPGKTYPLYDVWVLTHSDLRRTLRVKTFMDFTINALLKHQDQLKGVLTNTDE